MIGERQLCLQSLYTRQLQQLARSISNDASHPWQVSTCHQGEALRSEATCYRISFVPAAVCLLNQLCTFFLFMCFNLFILYLTYSLLSVSHMSHRYISLAIRELDFFVLCSLSVLLFCLSFFNGDGPSTAVQIYLQVFIKVASPDLISLQPCELCDPASTIQY